ncbi:NgoMIV family type II restriction endonuclease [Streptomyces sp. NBC_01197]|uniref:NgoMIV family type II restriction endonuclease n=1 Tax=Streptomyces sp. NBC_01197 TaxID=2903768 RepID=UPI002E157E9D|nr:hypothetical protein OG452_22610 [Streptomyces sp. NBC_01197]
MSATFATDLLGWKKADKTGRIVPNSADSDNEQSIALAGSVLDSLGALRVVTPDTPPKPGPVLEQKVMSDLSRILPEADPTRTWKLDRKELVTSFAQYSHLRRVDELVKESPELRVAIGRDYLIKPDVTVGLSDPSLAHSPDPFLHAAVSCKWTIRSDRVQNIRHEFIQMIRHRRGRQPHLVTVTAEPLPSRIAAIARGTGEVDAVYHIAFDAMAHAVSVVGNRQQQDDWHECVEQRRVLPYEELAPTLIRW